MNTELDSFAIADLENRYEVNRSNLYKRINTLKAKGYSLEFESRDRKSYANADQIALLDRLHRHIQLGRSMNTFPEMWSDSEDVPSSEVSQSLVRQFEKSRETQDTNGSAISKSPSQLIALSPEQLIELATAIASPAPASPVDPFANLEQIDRAYKKGWSLSTSQLAALLEWETLPGKAFSMYGYAFSPSGRGRQRVWKIEKG